MKTRKEIEEDLKGNEIKNGIQKEKEELKTLLNTFLGDFKNTNFEVNHKYQLSDEIALKDLKKTLEDINIPEEVKLIKENKIVFDDKTSKWLVWWGWISYCLFFLFTVWIVLLYKNRVPQSDYDALEKKNIYNSYLLQEIKKKEPGTYKKIKNGFDLELKK